MSDVSPRVSTVLANEASGVMVGATPLGSCPVKVISRSATNWRLRNRLLRSSKMTATTESPGMDCERRLRTPLVPDNAASMGCVTSTSVSSAESPGASVCITTRAGENSGNTSSGASTRRCTPNSSMASASVTISQGRRTEKRMSEEITRSVF